MKALLTLLGDAGVTMDLKKCFFFQNKIDYLGQVIRHGSLEVVPRATDAIEKKKTSNVTELRSCLELCKVFRRIVPKCAHISAPLNLELMKEQPMAFKSLNEENIGSLATLQQKMLTPTALELPKSKGEYFVETEA